MSEFIPALPLEELPLGSGDVVRVLDRVLALFHTENGVFALDNTCPHEGAPLGKGYVEGGTVLCPLHLWCFDLRSGESTDVPGASVAVYQTRVRDGMIEVCLTGEGIPDASPDGGVEGPAEE